MRRAVVLVVVLCVALAGCSGGGTTGDGQATTSESSAGDETGGDGAGGGTGDGDAGGGAGSDGGDGQADSGGGGGGADSSGAVWEPMEFSEPARYVFELRSEDQPEPGTLVWDVTAVEGDTVTVEMVYEMGDQRTETTVTGDRQTVESQLLVTPAATFLVLTWFSPSVTYYQDRTLSVGNEWSYSTPQGSASFAVTGTETMAGVECYRSEMRVNGSVVYEGCFAPELGLAPYTGYYDEDGTQVVAVELVEFQRH